jgi:hypothetical protein
MTDIDKTAWSPPLRDLHDYWRRIHPPGGGLPGRQHFDPVEIPALLPNLWLLDVHRDPYRFRFRLVGGEVEAADESVRAGAWLHEISPPGTRDAITQTLAGVVEDKRPLWYRGKPYLGYGERTHTIERLSLPMAGNGRDVDMLLCMTLFQWQPGHGRRL